MSDGVAPLAGAWIEICLKVQHRNAQLQSHPLRVRGLKSCDRILIFLLASVAPHVGAWIEIRERHKKSGMAASRTPCGCVD